MLFFAAGSIAGNWSWIKMKKVPFRVSGRVRYPACILKLAMPLTWISSYVFIC